MSPLLGHLRIFGEPPAALVRFDDLAHGTGSSGGVLDGPPDFSEASPRVDGALYPWRLTHYFDAPGRRPRTIATASRRLRAIADALEIPLPAGLERALAGDRLDHPALRQLALGIDARDDPAATRVKLYVLLEGDAVDLAAALCDAVALAPPAGAPLDRVHIVGFDLDLAGLRDLKLYWAIDPERAPRTLRRPAPWRPLLAGAQRVVYQQSLADPPRRSLHVQAASPAILWRLLEERASASPAARELEGALIRLDCDPRGQGPLQPRILAHPYADGALEPAVFNLYLHPTGR